MRVVFYTAALICSLISESTLAPWLPWYRRYLSIWPLVVQLALALADRSVSVWLAWLQVGLVLWNMITGLGNIRRGRRGKNRPAVGAALTTVQNAAFRREIAA